MKEIDTDALASLLVGEGFNTPGDMFEARLAIGDVLAELEYQMRAGRTLPWMEPASRFSSRQLYLIKPRMSK